MKLKYLGLLPLLTVGLVFSKSNAPAEAILPYEGSSFSEVWNKINQKFYSTLPVYKVVSAETLKAVADVAMNATLDNRNDFRPKRIKLVHPNGICLAGKWEIDRASDYSGFFAKNSRGLVIARASATQDFVNSNDYRAFGLAVKIFPTMNPDEVAYTSNLFSVDNIPGVKNQKFVNTLMTNQIPDFNFLNLRAVYRLWNRMPFLISFNQLSKEADTGPEDRNPLLRRTIEVARAGISKEFSLKSADQLPTYKTLEVQGQVQEPTWIGFQAEVPQKDSNQKDFRNEVLELVQKNGQLKYKILVSDMKDKKGNQMWTRIGSITFDQAVASAPCDLELHFHHPRTDD